LLEAEQTGNGPVDAVFKAINSVIKETENLTLYKYSVSAVTEEMESLGEVSVTLREKEKLLYGHRYTYRHNYFKCHSLY